MKLRFKVPMPLVTTVIQFWHPSAVAPYRNVPEKKAFTGDITLMALNKSQRPDHTPIGPIYVGSKGFFACDYI